MDVKFKFQIGAPVIHSFLGTGGNVIGLGFFQEGVPLALVGWQGENGEVQSAWFAESVLVMR